MLRLVGRVALLVLGVTVMPLLLMRAAPYSSSAVGEFFAASCTLMPCWQGIRPGETTTHQALAILRGHRWVTDISEVDEPRTVLIYWSWSRDYPFADTLTQQQSIVIAYDGIVQQIYLSTGLPLGDLWLTFGEPDYGSLSYVYEIRRVRMDNTTMFDRVGIAATASVYTDCVVDYPNFWRAPVDLWLQKAPPRDDSAAPLHAETMLKGYFQVLSSSC